MRLELKRECTETRDGVEGIEGRGLWRCTPKNNSELPTLVWDELELGLENNGRVGLRWRRIRISVFGRMNPSPFPYVCRTSTQLRVRVPFPRKLSKRNEWYPVKYRNWNSQ